MINVSWKINEVIRSEKELYFTNSKVYLNDWFLNSETFQIWKFQKALRYAEFYSQKKDTLTGRLLWAIWKRRKNTLGARLGFSIPENVFDIGLRIFHTGSISINPNAKVGKNCILVGNNCIGSNDGIQKSASIGSNCIMGYGSSVIGEVYLGNNIKIGAGAVVVHSFQEDNISLVGVPSKVTKRSCKR